MEEISNIQYLFEIYPRIDKDGLFRLYETIPNQSQRIQQLQHQSKNYIASLLQQGAILIDFCTEGKLEDIHELLFDLRQDEILLLTSDRMFKTACLYGQLPIVSKEYNTFVIYMHWRQYYLICFLFSYIYASIV